MKKHRESYRAILKELDEVATILHEEHLDLEELSLEWIGEKASEIMGRDLDRLEKSVVGAKMIELKKQQLSDEETGS